MTTVNLEALEKLPRLPLGKIHDMEGAKVALFVGNNTAHVGRLKMVAAHTRGNRTLAVTKVRVVRRNGRATRHAQTVIWQFYHGEKERGFAVLEVADRKDGAR
ncbi:hypothetical protein [Microbacterium sp. YY-01]|uniref:hypothetical protein n=1 Tax=Microbacterium sp. YY-01 TaxID=3421634 RepID=UPI003D164B30